MPVDQTPIPEPVPGTEPVKEPIQTTPPTSAEKYRSMLDEASIDKSDPIYSKYGSVSELYNGYKNLLTLVGTKSDGLKLDDTDSQERVIEKYRKFSGVNSQADFDGGVLAIEDSFLSDDQFINLRQKLYEQGLGVKQANAVFDSLEELNDGYQNNNKSEVDTQKVEWESKIREQHSDIKASNLSVQKAMENLSKEDSESIKPFSSHPVIYNLLKNYGDTLGESTSPFGFSGGISPGDLKVQNTSLIHKISSESNPAERALLTSKLQANLKLLKTV